MTAPEPLPDVRVVFTISHEDYPNYTDALYIPLADYTAGLVDVEAMKQERWEAWRQHIDNPPVAAEPVPVSQDEALVTARQALSDAMAAIDAVTADPVVIDQEP